MHPNHPLLRAGVHLYDNLLTLEGVEVINDNSGVLHFYEIPLKLSGKSGGDAHTCHWNISVIVMFLSDEVFM